MAAHREGTQRKREGGEGTGFNPKNYSILGAYPLSDLNYRALSRQNPICKSGFSPTTTSQASFRMNLRSIGNRLKEALPESGPPKRYRQRPCQGSAWRRQFPDVPKAEIREFLSLFADSFAYRDREKLRFRPDDSIMGIYRSQYPIKWMPDALELETFAKQLKQSYGVSLGSIWAEGLTLGRVFEATRANDA